MLSCRSRPDGGVGLEKKKVTTYFLSLSASFAANMPGLSAVKQDIPQFNRDRPGVVGLSPLNRSCGHPTFYLPPPHLSPFPAPQVKKHCSRVFLVE